MYVIIGVSLSEPHTSESNGDFSYIIYYMLRASCLKLEINEFRCYEAKIEESEVHIEDCEGWWLSGCHGSVAEHWRLKPEVSWVRLPAAASLLHFPLFSPHNIYYFLI